MMQHARTRVDAAALRGRRTLGLAGLTGVAVAPAAGSSRPRAGGASGGGSASTVSSSTLVIDSTFDLKTADPARSYEFTGELLAHNVYEHATTYAGNDLTKPVPQLTNFAWSNGEKTLTLPMNGTHRFADGTSVTAADIAFSYQPLQGT